MGSTTQPRSFTTAQTLSQTTMRDWIEQYFGLHAIDFWTGLANTNGSINSQYSYGDGIHLNNAGHDILYNRVVLAKILSALRSGTAVAPIVYVGANQTISPPTNPVTLTGSATPAYGTISSYQWSQVSGPSTATISTASSASTSVTGLT